MTGPARSLLTGERTALNFVQRLSGIATLAGAYVQAVEGTGCRILDTRKTTPGLRRLEKMAAAAGGAVNHRMGLYDAVLIKNNHISAAGGVRAALDRVRAAGFPPPSHVEIEVRTRAELDEALAHGATHLLLDNLTPAEAREWIVHIAGRATVEVSGGILLHTVRDLCRGRRRLRLGRRDNALRPRRRPQLPARIGIEAAFRYHVGVKVTTPRPWPTRKRPANSSSASSKLYAPASKNISSMSESKPGPAPTSMNGAEFLDAMTELHRG